MRVSFFPRLAIASAALLLAACGSPDAEPAANTSASIAAQGSVAPTDAPSPTTPPMMPSPSATVMPTDEPTATVAPMTEPTPAPSGSSSASPAMGGMEHVNIKLFMFDPNPLEVKVGTTVMWMNSDAIEHSVTAGVPDAPSNAFDSGLFAQGGSFSHTFDTPGEYAYFCTRHPSMNGRVVVTE